MATLGQRIKTIYIDKPNNLKAPNPSEAQAFEIHIDKPKKRIKESIKAALKS